MKKHLNILIYFLIAFNGLMAQKNSVESTTTYCKVWGLCKYYTNTNNVDWDEVFFKQYDKLLAVQNNDDLNILLKQLIKQTHLKETTTVLPNIGNSFTIDDFYQLKNKHNNKVLKTDFGWIFTAETISAENKQLLKQLLKTYKGKKPQTTSSGIVPEHKKENTYKAFDHKIALLALFRLYNVVEYYYPYKHLLDNDWDSVLRKMTPVFLNCQSNNEYKKALNLFSSYLQDSHVFIKHEQEHKTKKKSPQKDSIKIKHPIVIRQANGTFFIAKIINDSVSSHYNINIGDAIRKVNGKKIEVFINSELKQGGYSRKELAYYDVAWNFYYLDTLNITLNNGKEIGIEKMKMTYTEFLKAFGNVKKETKITGTDSIAYIYLPTSKYFKIDNLFRKYKNKKTIILDCRGYGTMASLRLGKLLNKKPQDVATIYTPSKKYPGVFERKKNENYYFSNTLDVVGKVLFQYKGKVFPTFNKPYKGKVVVLIDESAVSFGETVIMLIKAYAKDATLIGRPTMGANGNVTTLKLPLGAELYYTGIDFRFADGTELQRQGIQPTIYVPKTIEATINNKDEILEAALKHIKDGRGE